MKKIRFTSALLILIGATFSASAQTYPERAIRLIVPFGAGGVTDTVSRLLGKGLSAELGQSVVVENRPGASGIIGADVVAQAAPDGYTLLMGNISTLAVNAVAFARLPYDPARSFAPISMISQQPVVVATSAGRPLATVADLVAASRAKPGGLNFASGGASFELMNEAFKQASGAVMTNVRYKGDTDALASLMAGDTDVTFTSFSSVQPLVQAGKIRAVALTSAERSPLAPDWPTLTELGAPVVASSWQALMAPANTPDAVITRLNAAVKRVLASAEVQKQFSQQGVTAASSTPDELRTYAAGELKRWREVGASVGYTPQ